MTRLILLVGVALLLAHWLNQGLARLLGPPKQPPVAKSGRRGPLARQPKRHGGRLVACARCGVHVAAARAHSAGGRQYCSVACGEAGERQAPESPS
ncbi:MAG: hypothetical protein AAF657_16025 [Acidobacteriota bacterium]